MSDGLDQIASDVDESIDAIHGQWDKDDPEVLALPGKRKPVVADVRGDLRVLHTSLIYARSVSRNQLVEHCDSEQEVPEIRRLSEFSERFDREDFEDTHPEAEAEP